MSSVEPHVVRVGLRTLCSCSHPCADGPASVLGGEGGSSNRLGPA